VIVFVLFAIFRRRQRHVRFARAFSTGRRLRPVHDHRRRRLPFDDRGRVRPLRRFDDRLCRHDDRDLLVTLGWPVWQAILITFALCLAIGALNGFIVVRTGLPSFIVTLAFLFILRGFTIYLPQLIERKTIIGGIDKAAEGDWLAPLFGGKILTGSVRLAGRRRLIAVFERGNRAGQPVVDGIPMLIVWALVLVAFGTFLLTRTKFGNWILPPAATRRRRAMSACRSTG
jgi:branched-subunit amino acid ABC-type transport system permease component